MTEEKYKQLSIRLDALERLILAPARRAKRKPNRNKPAKTKIQFRRRLDSL